MKNDIHPTFFPEAKVTCSCGNSFITGSTKEAIRVDVCYKCHPLYTGEKRYIDTLGTVERFQKKQQIAETYREKMSGKKPKGAEKERERPKTLRELLMES